MTGGAAAGFSLATASPITAVIFSIEELHKRFSPMLITIASLSVISAQVTSHLLSLLGICSGKLFHITNLPPIAPKLLFAPLIVGTVCGGVSILFTKFYKIIDKAVHSALAKISIKIAFPVIFACVALIGFFLSETLGTGHSLIDQLLQGGSVWYILILVFLIRAIFTMTSNTAGATGGIFLPTLAFGAIIGSLCADGMIASGLIGQEHYTLMVVLGISAFLASTSRIPVTACIFAIEAMGGINNILAIIISTVFAILVVEISGFEDFTDTVIDTKLRAINKGKKKTVVEVALTVNKDSFAVGKELRDILWPASCVVVSFKRAPENHEKTEIGEGDIITVHYKTYSPATTASEIEHLVGAQSEQTNRVMKPIKKIIE
jgi:H+/Cl- antiporter ClcA